ncbi:MAG: YggU family protein [Spirochaetae bacterium HGW-Spirochaetae-1]|jgi:hypothetical protein|nr:MAG: YggU family protein [Spirochaetae bacterium HGW-Spirochaetae-1]
MITGGRNSYGKDRIVEKKETILDITVSPKSSRTQIVLCDDNVIKVYLNSPPVDGAANEECVRIFAKTLHVPKSSVVIVKGHKSRKKRLLIVDMTTDEVFRKLRS